MTNTKVLPSQLKGKITIPPSKSLSHRALIAASLSKGKSKVDNLIMSKDTEATINIIRNLGVDVEFNGSSVIIESDGKLKVVNDYMNCNESGSTIRFFIPIALTTGEKVTFDGKGKLVERPMHPYYEIFEKQNLKYETNNGCLPLTAFGKLKSGAFELRGDISSQFITGLLFALPLLEEDSTIKITTELESKGYVDLTLDILNKFGIQVENRDYKEFFIKGNQEYTARDYYVEGDYSQVAFWLAAGLLSDSITCAGLNMSSLQGDSVIVDILKEMNGNLVIEDDSIIASSSKLKGTNIDVSQCPDLVPILAVVAALSEGTTTIYNAARVRIKECDRLHAITTELNKIGASVEEREDSLIIHGKESLEGGEVDSWNDHRIVMALAVAALKCKTPVTIKDSGAISKSYPTFFKDFISLGGVIDEWNLG
jgi:3-phosphoshikimate 1-carboxyvinyltransferase